MWGAWSRLWRGIYGRGPRKTPPFFLLIEMFERRLVSTFSFFVKRMFEHPTLQNPCFHRWMAIHLTRVDLFLVFLWFFDGFEEKERWKLEELKGEVDMLSRFPLFIFLVMITKKKMNMWMLVSLWRCFIHKLAHYKTRRRILIVINQIISIFQQLVCWQNLAFPSKFWY